MLHRSCFVGLVVGTACTIPDVTFHPPDGTASPQGASCAGLPSTCGADGNDSCCDSPELPAGSYDRSYDLAGDVLSGAPTYRATISPFRLDRYEVTVGRFRAFVDARMGTQATPPLAGAGAHPNIAGSGWNASWNDALEVDTSALLAALTCESQYPIWTDTAGGNERRPMNCLTWFEAMAFCAWDGGYLPTEAEWNYAAAGGDQQRAYPWSSPAGSLTINDSLASYFDGVNCVGDARPGCAVTDLVPGGRKPGGDARWGQADLAGNVWEWVLDWSGDYATECTDCANLTVAANRVIRGGSFFVGASDLRTASRNSFAPASRASVGVRCARAP